MAIITHYEWRKNEFPFLDRRTNEHIMGVLVMSFTGESDDDLDVSEQEDFKDALHDLKDEVPPGLRTWDPSKRVWLICVTPGVRKALSAIFNNGQDVFDILEEDISSSWL